MSVYFHEELTGSCRQVLLVLSLSSCENYQFHSGFSKTQKISNIGIIANFVFPCIYSFLLYLHHMMLVNVTLDITWYKRIIFQYSRLYWSCSFLMAQLKQSWQYWHSCIAQNLRKNLITKILLLNHCCSVC